MTQTDFLKYLKEAHAEEKKDLDKYMEMAKNAPTPAMRDMLYEIAKDEVMHHAKLECMVITMEGSMTA